MSAYGISLIVTMALGLFPWSYVFEVGGKMRSAPRVPLGLSLGFLVLSTFLYGQMLSLYGPERHGWSMVIFLTVTIQIGTIALGGIVWSIIGQRAARLFLDKPLIILVLACAAALLTLFFSLTFTPAT